MRLPAVLVLVLVAAACDGGGAAESTTILPGSTTSSLQSSAACDDLADEAVDLVGDLATLLEEVPYEQLLDRSLWPDDLIAIEERGAALEAEAAASECDPLVIRRAVAEAAENMEAEAATAVLLLDLLSR